MSKTQRMLREQPLIVSAVLFLSTLIVQGATLNYSSLYLDEAVSAFEAGGTWRQLWEYSLRDSNPPLYFFLLKAWSSVFGVSVWSIRGLSLLFSAGAVVMFYQLIRRFTNGGVLEVALMLVMFSSVQLHFAQEARGFAMSLFFAVTSMYWWFRFRESSSRKALVLLGVFQSLLLFTHYANVFLVIVQALGMVLIPGRSKKQLLQFFLMQVTLLLLLVPELLTINADKLGNTSKFLSLPEPKHFWKVLSSFAGSQFMVWAGLIAIFVGAVLRIYKEVTWKPLYLMAWLWCFGTLILGFAFSYWVPLFTEKYLLYASMGWYLLIYLSVFDMPYGLQVKSINASIIIALVFLSYEPEQMKGEDWRGVSQYTKELQQGGDVGVLITPDFYSKAFAYYYDQQAFGVHDSVPHRLYPQQVYGTRKMGVDFFDYIDHEEWILIIKDYSGSSAKDHPLQVFQHHFELIENQRFKGIDTYRFRRTAN